MTNPLWSLDVPNAARRPVMGASKNLTAEQRVERARNAGRAAHSIDHYVAKIVDRAAELSPDHRARLIDAVAGRTEGRSA